ncbi:hypothetical protein ACVMHZ_007014 [Bradyrhizobium liaoningense]
MVGSFGIETLPPSGEVGEGFMLLRIDADREIHGQADGLDLVAAVGLLVVQVRLVLKRIGLDVAGIERRVWHHVVGEFEELNIESALGGDRLHGLEDLRMRPRRHPDLDGLGPGCGGQCGEHGREDQRQAKRHLGLRRSATNMEPYSLPRCAKSIAATFWMEIRGLIAEVKQGRLSRRSFRRGDGRRHACLLMGCRKRFVQVEVVR